MPARQRLKACFASARPVWRSDRFRFPGQALPVGIRNGFMPVFIDRGLFRLAVAIAPAFAGLGKYV